MPIRTVRTMCPMNCHPTLCGMLVDVEDGRVVAVRGDPENPDSRGFLCVRGRAALEVLDNPRRVLHPLARDRAGTWRRVSWEDALDRVAAAVRAVGPAAVGLWSGHGVFTTNYGTRLHSHLLRRFANLSGCQWWHPAMICWGLGAFGLGLTGILEVHTPDDLAAHARLVLLWGANLASQPTTAPHVVAARRRGAGVIAIDVRRAEAAAHADEVLLVRPGTDAALALALMHVILGEGLYDRDFVARHTVGFEALATHVRAYPPAWAAAVTGVPAARIVALARRYATTRPAMILLGGSSMHKGAAAYHAARAIACLPALTGNLGVPGGGFGPRHGGAAHGQALASIAAEDRRRPGPTVPNQMGRIIEALREGLVRVLLLFGTDMLSSFADAGRVADALERAGLVVSYDLFLNDTARAAAHLVLPATAWVEELGCKSTNTHLYLMPRAVDPPGEARSLPWVLRELARRLDLAEYFPWADEAGALDALLAHPATGHATVAALAAEGGIRPLRVSPVAHPDLRFPTPSGRVEFFSERAAALGLPALPVYVPSPPSPFPLTLAWGRTLTHFHGFYEHGRALPTLARLDPEPEVWLAPEDAAPRGVADGAWVRLWNDRGAFQARARVTDRIATGTVWLRDGWPDANRLTAGDPVLPDAAVDLFPAFAAGQASFAARVEVEAVAGRGASAVPDPGTPAR